MQTCLYYSSVSRPIQRADSKTATQVLHDVIKLLKDIKIDVIGNEGIIRKDIGKKVYT